MASDLGTIGALARALVIALRPLADAVADPARFRALMARLGWNVSAMPPAFASLGASVNTADAKLAALPASPSILDELNLAAAVRQVFDAIQGIGVVPPGADASFLPEFRARLFDLLLMDRLSAERPDLFNAFQALGIIKFDIPDSTTTRPSFPRLTFDWPSLGALVRDPTSIVTSRFAWGTPGFDHVRMVDEISELCASLDFPIDVGGTDDYELHGYLDGELPPGASRGLTLNIPFFFINIGGIEREASFVIRGLPGVAGKLPGFVIEPRIPAEFDKELRLLDTIRLRLRAGSNTAGLCGITVRPGDTAIRFPLAPGTPPPAGGVGVGFDFTPQTPTLMLGSRDGTRLEWQGGSIDLTAAVTGAAAEFAVSAGLNGLALVISGKGESLFDGFLEKLLGIGDSRVNLPLGIEWGQNGIRFQGSGGFDVRVSPHITLGPIRVDTVDVRLRAMSGGPPDARLEIGATISGTLGPLDFFVRGIGLRADATFSKGNLGPFDLSLSFLPPTGAGLSLDVGGFRGGGFLDLDAARGEYAGGLELDFQGIVTVKAFGLLTTKFPDGSRGFSLTIIISAEFPPIQLGLGFTLLAVGGLIGVSRTVDENALRDGVHAGALDSVLFPTNLVQNAPRIVNDLRRLFPPAHDHFLVGPMVKLGWGTPTIVSLEFGFILDIPRPAFFIIGRLRIGLPFQDAPLFDIRVAFAGGVDFALGQLWFDGTLHDSRLLTFSLTGDMAVRLYWKENANFVLTIGGFHPAYTPPPMQLGNLQRLGITIFDGNPRLRADTYLAITSNTVQFGAKAELLFGLEDVFDIYGFIALDVLIHFDPFRFVATLTAMLAVRAGGDVLMGIRIEALLEGPTPWHAKGTGHFEISLIIDIEIDVDFEVTLGDPRRDMPLPVKVLPKLVEAMSNPNSWRAVMPPASSLHVTLREFQPPADAVVLHPFGTVEVTEKLVPLNLPIQKLGTQPIEDGRVFGVEKVRLGTFDDPRPPMVREQFAPAQFIDMPDTQKLSSRSFEHYEGGVRVGGGSAVNTDYVKTRDLEYEVIYLPKRRGRSLFRLALFLFRAFAHGGAVAHAPLSAAVRAPSPIGAPKVDMRPEQFVVASRTDLTMHHSSLVFSSEAEAQAAMASAVDRDPSLTKRLQVVPLSMTKAA